MTTGPPDLLSITATAKALGYDRSTIVNWIKRGKLDTVTEGLRTYVRQSDVDAMLARRISSD